MDINASDDRNLINGRIKELTKLIEADPRDDAALFERGKLNWRLGNRAAAMNDYAAALEVNPSSPAAMALEQARNIDSFYNHDLYNP